jgi:hypothetical protein
MWTLGRLVAADGTMVVYGDFVYPLGDRFIPDIALAVDGPFDRLAKAITMSLDDNEKTDFIGLDAAEAAEELAAVVLRALPGPDELADCGCTRTRHRCSRCGACCARPTLARCSWSRRPTSTRSSRTTSLSGGLGPILGAGTSPLTDGGVRPELGRSSRGPGRSPRRNFCL